MLCIIYVRELKHYMCKWYTYFVIIPICIWYSQEETSK